MWVNYYVKLQLEGSFRDLNSSGQNYDNCRIEIIDEKTTSSESWAESDTTPYVIRNAEIVAKIQTPSTYDLQYFHDRIPKYAWSGSYKDGGGLSLSTWIGILNLPIGISWSPYDQVNTSTQIAPQDTIAVKLAYPGYITSTGYYGFEIYKEQLSSSNKTKMSAFIYTFDLVNKASWQGEYDVEMYVTSTYE